MPCNIIRVDPAAGDVLMVAPPPDLDGVIVIEFGAVPNGRKRSDNGQSDGWLPMIRVNGRGHSDTWATIGLDHDDALEQARALADEEIDRYCGDWDIFVQPLAETRGGL